jgi:deoxyhypusine synthase
MSSSRAQKLYRTSIYHLIMAPEQPIADSNGSLDAAKALDQHANVFMKSVALPADTLQVKGYDFNEGVNYEKLFKSYMTTGYQATHLAQGIEIINKMIAWRLSHDPIADDEKDELKSAEARETVKCKIFLGYTSNLVSAGIRESIRFLVQNQMVNVLVSSAGGVEEDFIKCLGSTYVGKFSLDYSKYKL